MEETLRFNVETTNTLDMVDSTANQRPNTVKTAGYVFNRFPKPCYKLLFIWDMLSL